jgi:hypothetical protein
MKTEMFWVVEYNNNQALPEYDEFTGKVNRFAEVDHKNILRLWWLPITPRMATIFPDTRVNPRLRRHAVELKGSKGFIARRIQIQLGLGSHATLSPQRIKCYVLGIEGGPRREVYPDGTVINKPYPDHIKESQSLLHG